MACVMACKGSVGGFRASGGLGDYRGFLRLCGAYRGHTGLIRGHTGLTGASGGFVGLV